MEKKINLEEILRDYENERKKCFDFSKYEPLSYDFFDREDYDFHYKKLNNMGSIDNHLNMLSYYYKKVERNTLEKL